MYFKKSILLLFLLLLSTMCCLAETFILKDGNKISGSIISHEDGLYTISTSLGIIDINDADIEKMYTEEEIEQTKQDVQEITIKTGAKKREFVPAYDDSKFHDPLYIAYSQAKFSAIGLTATGATFTALGSIGMAAGLSIYFLLLAPDKIEDSAIAPFFSLLSTFIGEGSSEPFSATSISNMSLGIILPLVLTPTIVGVVLLLSCIGPWIYANKLLKKWQDKYTVDMSYTNDNKLNLGFAIKL